MSTFQISGFRGKIIEVTLKGGSCLPRCERFPVTDGNKAEEIQNCGSLSRCRYRSSDSGLQLMSATVGSTPSKEFRLIEDAESKLLLMDLLQEIDPTRYRSHVQR